MIGVGGQQTPRAHGEQDEVGGGETPFDRVAHERPYYGAVIGSKPMLRGPATEPSLGPEHHGWLGLASPLNESVAGRPIRSLVPLLR